MCLVCPICELVLSRAFYMPCLTSFKQNAFCLFFAHALHIFAHSNIYSLVG